MGDGRHPVTAVVKFLAGLGVEGVEDRVSVRGLEALFGVPEAPSESACRVFSPLETKYTTPFATMAGSGTSMLGDPGGGQHGFTFFFLHLESHQGSVRRLAVLQWKPGSFGMNRAPRRHVDQSVPLLSSHVVMDPRSLSAGVEVFVRIHRTAVERRLVRGAAQLPGVHQHEAATPARPHTPPPPGSDCTRRIISTPSSTVFKN